LMCWLTSYLRVSFVTSLRNGHSRCLSIPPLGTLILQPANSMPSWTTALPSKAPSSYALSSKSMESPPWLTSLSSSLLLQESKMTRTREVTLLEARRLKRLAGCFLDFIVGDKAIYAVCNLMPQSSPIQFILVKR
jgi:hypothetical protein